MTGNLSEIDFVICILFSKFDTQRSLRYSKLVKVLS